MRYLFATLLAFCTVALAADEPYSITAHCEGGDVVLVVAMSQPGTLTFKVAHDYCGKDV